MKYTDPELIEHLSAEYVLGTMVGKARLRFERLQMESYKIRQSVWQWEQRLYPMSEGIDDVAPPNTVWKGIQQRIHPEDKSQKAAWHSLFFLRSWSALATAMVLVLAVIINLQLPGSTKTQPQDYMAVFNNSHAQPLWMISSNLNTGEISIRAVNATAAAVDKTFELWMLPQGNGAPRSLGLMPVANDRQQFVLPASLLNILSHAQGLAVSIEPSGGSPTGAPTGPVVYQAKLIEI